MSKSAPATSAKIRPVAPTNQDQEPAPVPTEAEARARLAGFRSTIGRMTQAEFDALVAIAAAAEDREAGQ